MGFAVLAAGIPMNVRFALLVALIACGSSEEEAMQRAAEQTREPARAEPAAMESPPEMPELTKAEQAAVVLEDTVGEALEAAHAAEVGASICDAAYESTAELVRVVRERFPEDAREMPPRDLFVDACQRLPDEAQQCLMARYAVEHQDECNRIQEALPRADRERIERLLRGE